MTEVTGLDTAILEKALDTQMDTFFLFELASGKALRWNRAFRDISGYSDAEIARLEAPASYYDAKDLERAGPFLKQVMVDGTGTIELELVCKDGQKVPTEYRVSTINDEKDEPRYLISIGRDISARKQAEEMRKKNEAKWRAIFDNAGDAIFIQRLDSQIIDANTKALELYGYELSEMLELTALDVDRSSDVEKLVQLVAQLKENDHFIFSTIHTRKDGTAFPVEVNLRQVTIDDQLVLLSLVRDITERKRSEQALKASEEKFRTLFESMHEGVCLHEVVYDDSNNAVDYRITDVNPSYETILDLERKDVVGNLASEIYGVDGPPYLEVYARVADTGEPTNFETYFPPMDRHFSIGVFSPRKGSFVTVFEDISERKQAERQIAEKMDETDKQRKAILNILQDIEGAKLKLEKEVKERKAAEAALEINYQNQKVLNDLAHIALEDIPLAEKLQKAIATILSTPWLSILPKGAIFVVNEEGTKLNLVAHHELAKPLLEICLEVPFGRCLCGLAASDKEIQFADRIDHRHENSFDGIPEHGHYCVPLLYKDRVQGVLNVYVKAGHLPNEKEREFLDSVANTLASLIEQKQAEVALAESEERYREIFENASDLIQSITPKGEFRYVNQAWMNTLGYTWAELEHRNIFEFIHPDSQAHCQAFFERLLAGESLEQIEAIFISKSGNKVYLEGSASCKFEGDRPVSTRGIFHDITERKQAEEALQEANTELDAFVRTASHDLRSPLVSLTGFLALLKDMEGEKLSEQAQRYIGRIESNAQRMERLLDDLLKLSRAGRDMAPRQNVNLTSMMDLIRSDFKPLMEAKGATLSLPDELPMVFGEISAISQIFTNLISNALKYMGDEPEPEVELVWRTEDDHYHFSVTDNGIGIDPAYHEKIFESFETLQDQRAGQVDASGVGLNIVKRIIERHNGRVWVESDGQKGSTFHFTLPTPVPENEFKKDDEAIDADDDSTGKESGLDD